MVIGRLRMRLPVAWVDHVDQHVHLNKTGADVTTHWEHETPA